MGVVNDLSTDMKVSDKDKRFIADFYTHAFVGIIVQWIKHGMRSSPEEMVAELKKVAEGSILGALTRYNYI
jgi:hypothetical protein